MDGFYPSISKVLLATIGPYKQHLSVPSGTAYAILRDAVYKELQKLPSLYAKKPEKLADFIPANVTYDHEKNTLTHLYFGGQAAVTDLNALSLSDIDFYDKALWRTANTASSDPYRGTLLEQMRLTLRNCWFSSLPA